MEINKFGIPFRGKRIIHPGAYDHIDGSGMIMPSSEGASIPVVIGEAESGKPGELVWIRNIEEATNYLGNGELLTAVKLMMSPTSDGGGSDTIGVIVSNENVRATGTVGGLEIGSLEYGTGGNSTQIKIEEGSIEGSKRVSVNRLDLNITELYDDLGAIIEIKYIGDLEYASVSIETSEGGKFLTTKVGSTEEDSVLDIRLNLNSDQFFTAQRIVGHVNTLSGYSARIVNSRSGSIESSTLDLVENKEIKESSYIMSKLGIEHVLNTVSELIEVTETGTITDTSGYESLSGGLNGVSPMSWSEYFEVCKSNFLDILVLLTKESSIHAEGLEYIKEMDSRGDRQMLFVGGGIGESITEVVERASVLNHSRAVVAYPGIYSKYVGNGKLEQPAYMTAAMIAGRVSGVTPAEPITFDYFDVVGLGEDLIAGDPSIDKLLLSGVCTLERVQNRGIRLVQGITTYTSDNNSLYREISVRRVADVLSASVRRKMEDTFIGRKGLSTTPSSVTTVVIDELDRAVKNEEIMGYDPKSILVRFERSAIYVDYAVAPIEPINYILLTSYFVPSI